MSKVATTEEYFMNLALNLAKNGLGWTSPNPMVGAVIVKNDQIIGQGYHKKFGGPHAEIEAINSATGNLQGSILYVNLEPHGYIGKTAPCTDAIIACGIKSVVCSTLDPNPKVQGDGIAKLKKAGISVKLGALESQAKQLNEQFFTFHDKKRPFIALKFASSIDGKLSMGQSEMKWITNKAARDHARGLRAEYQAILVGINTVLSDNPHLGARTPIYQDPLRIILDSKLRIPLESLVLRDSRAIIATTDNTPISKRNQLERKGIEIISFSGSVVPLPALCRVLYKRGIISIFVEGGGQTIGSFINFGIVDKLYAFYAPLFIGGTSSFIHSYDTDQRQQQIQLKDVTAKSFGDNFMISGHVANQNI